MIYHSQLLLTYLKNLQCLLQDSYEFINLFYRLSLNIFHRHLVYFGITLTNYVKLIHLIKRATSSYDKPLFHLYLICSQNKTIHLCIERIST